MAVTLTESEFAQDAVAILRKARAGEEVVIEDALGSVRLTRIATSERGHLLPRYTHPRLLSEILADLEKIRPLLLCLRASLMMWKQSSSSMRMKWCLTLGQCPRFNSSHLS
jgi:hypothetical protein